MLKSCAYCGRIHDEHFPCPAKEKNKKWRDGMKYSARKERDVDEYRFRNSRSWQRMRDHIKHRDRCLCLCCLAELQGTVLKYQTEGLSVHHIKPLAECFEDRLKEDNLITVCSSHHEMCERGEISRTTQRELVTKSQEGKL